EQLNFSKAGPGDRAGQHRRFRDAWVKRFFASPRVPCSLIKYE
ncbi:unnamed protein product, partial [Heterotrigona itama]